MIWALGAAGLFVVAVVTTGVAVLRWRYAVITVRGASMAPALADGDRLVGKRCGLARISSGDLVVFREPGFERRHRPALLTGASRDPWVVKRAAAMPGEPVPEAVRPAVAGAIRVPDGMLVVLGDGSDSRDSRLWGFVAARHVLGTATLSKRA